AGLVAGGFGEPQQNVFLLLGQPAGHLDFHPHHLVSPAEAPHPRHALAPQPEFRPVLGAFGNCQLVRALQRRHFDLRTQRRLNKGNRLFQDDVRALADEQLVGPDPDAKIKISGRAAALTRIAFSAEPDAVARVDARGNAYPDAPALLGDSPAAAAGARLLRKLALSPAAAARGRGDELPEGRLPGVPHLPGAAAVGTREDGRAGLRAVAVAAGTRLPAGHLEGPLRAEDGLFELDDDLHLQVPAPHRPASAGPGTAAHDRLEDVEDVAEPFEAGEAFGRIKAAEAARALRPVKGRVPEPIVAGARLGIGQHPVGFVDFLELFLRVRVVFV